MRTRTDNAQLTGQVSYSLVDDLTGVVTNYAPVNKYTSMTRKRIDDVVTFRFDKRRHQGEVIMNPCTRIKGIFTSEFAPYEYSYQQVRDSDNTVLLRKHWVYHSAGQPESFYDDGAWAITPSINTPYYASKVGLYPAFSDLSGLKARTLIRAYENATNTNAMALVSLAELHKTAESIGRLATLVPRFDQWLLSRRRKDFTRKGLLKMGLEASSQWLEYRYGFMQIYYDIQSFANVARRSGKERVRFTSSERAVAGPLTQVWDSSSTYSTLKLTQRRQTAVEVTSGVLIQVKPTSDLERMLADAGLASLLTSSWELVPLSFLVDWVVDIGGYLAAWQGQYAVPIVGSWQTVTHTYTGSQTREYGGRSYHSGGVLYEGFYTHNASSTEVVTSVVREANPSLPTIPPFSVQLNWKRVLDAIALLTGRARNWRQLGLRHRG